jgi:hypothetical protein
MQCVHSIALRVMVASYRDDLRVFLPLNLLEFSTQFTGMYEHKHKSQSLFARVGL